MNFNWKKIILLSTILVAILIFPKISDAQFTQSVPNCYPLMVSLLSAGGSSAVDTNTLSDCRDQINAGHYETRYNLRFIKPNDQSLSDLEYQLRQARDYLDSELKDRGMTSIPDGPRAIAEIAREYNSYDLTSAANELNQWENPDGSLKAGLDPNDPRYIALKQRYSQLQQNQTNANVSTVKQQLSDDKKALPDYQCQILPYPNIGGCLLLGFQYLLSIILWLTAWILYLASWIFNESVKISVLQFSDYAKGTALPGIEVAWKLARDLANIFFIFILLYVAIKTVLGEGGAQKLVANVIVMALLVNFSAVIPRVIIDASNVLALQFYNSIGKEMNGGGRDISSSIINWDTRSQYFTNGNVNDDQLKEAEPLGLSDTIVKSIGTFFLMLTLAFVLVTAAVLFIYRTIVLLVVIMLSPLAIMGWALPKYGSYSNKWLDTLTKEAIWAPAFLFMLYMILKIFEDTNRSTQGYEQIILFILMNGMLMAAIGIASSFSTKGADTANKLGNKFKGFFTGAAAGVAGGAGVYSIGNLARRAAGTDTIKNLSTNKWTRRLGGVALQNQLSKLGNAKFGTSAGYSDRVTKNAERTLQFNSNPELQAKYITSLDQQSRSAAFSKLSDRQKVILQDTVKNNPNAESIINNLLNDLTLEEREKIDKTRGESIKQQSEMVDRFKAGQAVEFFTKGQIRKIKSYNKKTDGTDDESRPIYEIGPDGKEVYDKFDINSPDAESKIKEYLSKVKDSQAKQLAKSLKFSTPNEVKLSETIISHITPGQAEKLLGEGSDLTKEQYIGITNSISKLPSSNLTKRFISKNPELSAKFII